MDLDSVVAFTVVAFAFGFAARLLGQPPLIGFLAGGFLLKVLGYGSSPGLERVADLGVTLLLFAIGLKLDVRGLLRRGVWGGASLHALGYSLAVALLLWLLSFTPWGLVAGLDLRTCLLLGFALSFSSTVFAVKVQEETGNTAAAYARLAIGFLIMQDIFAVVFLAAAKGQAPSPWALAVVPALVVARPLLFWLLDRAGHGELLVLLAWVATAAGYLGFESVQLKGDLGALIVGAIIAGHPKAAEMARGLLSFKDLFLVGFFLSIGLKATLSWSALGMALVLLALMPLKVGAYFWIMTGFRQRARSALLSALQLASYSEFGLIIAALALTQGWIGGEWLAVFALTVALSFLFAAPLNQRALDLYARFQDHLLGFERSERLPEDRPVPIGDHRVVVFGMGGVGATCYDQLLPVYGDDLIGVDAQRRVAVAHRAEGRRCVVGDASDRDFWDRCSIGTTELVLLCLPDPSVTVDAARQLRDRGFTGRIGAIARYDDEVETMREAGVDLAFSMYREAGIGLVDSVVRCVEEGEEPPTAQTTAAR